MVKAAIGILLILFMVSACRNDDKKDDTKKEVSAAAFMTRFKKVSPPYQLSDTGLAKNSDTTSLTAMALAAFFSDSLRAAYFSKGARLKYTPLARLEQKDKETYLIVKASGLDKKAAFLLVYDKENVFAASYPFLLPDNNSGTAQLSSIDKNFLITKSVIQRNGTEVVGEGKEVVAYDASSKSFSLIAQDALNDAPAELVNPIDTFRKTNKLAGDYYLAKKNIVAVRDGRYPNQLLVYIHTENESGDCKGELKGEFLIASPTTATYRLGGDPCVLALNFGSNTVSIKEETGCGNHREVDCPLSGTFTRKKQAAPKQASKKPKAK